MRPTTRGSETARPTRPVSLVSMATASSTRSVLAPSRLHHHLSVGTSAASSTFSTSSVIATSSSSAFPVEATSTLSPSGLSGSIHGETTSIMSAIGPASSIPVVTMSEKPIPPASPAKYQREVESSVTRGDGKSERTPPPSSMTTTTPTHGDENATRAYLESKVSPLLIVALDKLARLWPRPDNPVEWLGKYLLEHSKEMISS